MFNKYLKSIYNITEKYKSDSNTFKNMLIINNDFIYNLKNKNTKSKLNMTGGNGVDSAIQELKQATDNALAAINAYTVGTPVNIEALKDSLKKLALLEAYITRISALVPDKDKIQELKSQLTNIKTTLHKYIDV